MAQPKVDNLQDSVCVKAQVLRLYVAVANALRVAVLDASDQLVEIRARDHIPHNTTQGRGEQQRHQVATGCELLHNGNRISGLLLCRVADSRMVALEAIALFIGFEFEAAAVLVVAPPAGAAAFCVHAIVSDHVNVVEFGQGPDFISHLRETQATVRELLRIHDFDRDPVPRLSRANANLAVAANPQGEGADLHILEEIWGRHCLQGQGPGQSLAPCLTGYVSHRSLTPFPRRTGCDCVETTRTFISGQQQVACSCLALRQHVRHMCRGATPASQAWFFMLAIWPGPSFLPTCKLRMKLRPRGT